MPHNIFWYGCWSAVRYMVRKPWICASDYRPVSLTPQLSPPHTVASLNVIVRTAECRLGEGMALDALG